MLDYSRKRKNRMTQKYHSEEDRGPRIDIWKKPRKVIYSERELGKNFLQVSIEINQPVMDNGRDGFYQLSTRINVNNHYIRVPPQALIELMDVLQINRDKILDAAKHVRDENDIIRESQETPRRRRRQNNSE